jgi:C-terminal processing protease CtpA/Prc
MEGNVTTKKTKTIKGLSLLAILIMSIPMVLAAASGLEAEAAKRLAGLGKVWGTVKFFHPAMAGREIDWDKALVEAIPLVRKASTPEEYRAAVNHMLSFLKDPATQAIRPNPPAETKPGAAARPGSGAKGELTWPEKGIALLSARSHLLFTDPAKSDEFIKLVAKAAQEKTVILDLRRTDGNSEDESTSYYLADAVQRALAAVLSGEIALPTTRHLMYSGYPTQRGNTSGGYFSAFVYAGANRLTGLQKNQTVLSWIFLLNESGEALIPLLAGLQNAGLATIIREGAASGGTPGAVHFLELPGGVQVLIRTSESVNPDGSIGFSPNLSLPTRTEGRPDAALAAAIDIAAGRKTAPRQETKPIRPVPDIRPDNPYPEMAYPAAEYRLMALFRFWTVIENFFPYKHLLDRPWEETLAEFVPRMDAAANAREYTLAVAEMVSRITDTHGFISSQDLREYFGPAFPPLEVKNIEGETVVTHIVPESKDNVQGIEIGDVVLAVDGEEIAKRRERLGRYIAASTPQALQWRIHQNILGGTKETPARLRLKNRAGLIEDKLVARSSGSVRSARIRPVFSVLPEGYGYIDLARLTVPQVAEAFEAIKATPAVIFDMRGYPRGTAWAITPRLIEKKIAVAKFRRPEPHAVSLDWPSLVSFDQIIEPSPEWKYKGKVVVLINEEAISQAEHTCLFLEAAVDAHFVGSPTNGANGDVTTMALPGGIYVNFTGHDVRHADGRQLQRVGIQPHIPVKPTIAGIRAGKDEVLERAATYLKTGK